MKRLDVFSYIFSFFFVLYFPTLWVFTELSTPELKTHQRTAINFFDSVVFLWSLQSHRRDDSQCGQPETQSVHSGDVSENALYVTYTRRERESACFEKRVC